jgi:misacylated tRNA(Ala) deacylase
MAYSTKKLFIEDAYLTTTDASVVAINDRGGIILDQTNFYATSGGQPGDSGYLERVDGSRIDIALAVYGESKEEIVHVPQADQTVPEVGEKLTLSINWERRFKLMKMHSALHLLTVIAPYPITGASVSEDVSRIDFDIPELETDKFEITEKLMQLISDNHPIFTRWISEEELEANPGLVKSRNVRPPKGQGEIRLVCIGDDGAIDTQPCGGTHVRQTREIGDMYIAKIEKKGKQNRRFRVAAGTMPG